MPGRSQPSRQSCRVEVGKHDRTSAASAAEPARRCLSSAASRPRCVAKSVAASFACGSVSTAQACNGSSIGSAGRCLQIVRPRVGTGTAGPVNEHRREFVDPRCNRRPCKFGTRGRMSIAQLFYRVDGRLQPLGRIDERLLVARALQVAGQGVVVLGRDGVELVIVAAGATDGQRQKRLGTARRSGCRSGRLRPGARRPANAWPRRTNSSRWR